MPPRSTERLLHIRESIDSIRSLLGGKSLADVVSERHVRAAFERYLEIVSEASRHLPADWKTGANAEIPWRNIADIGNILRHAYHRGRMERLWAIYEDDLDILEVAVDAMIAEHPDQA